MTNLYLKSIEVIENNQHPSGAYVASPSFDTYKYSWLRDGSFIAYSMDIAERYNSADKFHDWVDRVISVKTDKVNELLYKMKNKIELGNQDYLPTRYTLEGIAAEDDWPNFQLDGYGTWLWALTEHIVHTGKYELLARYRQSIDLTVRYLSGFWMLPNYDCWEEFGDKVHTATLSCIYGGLVSINKLLKNQDIESTAHKIKEYIYSSCTKNDRLVKFIGTDIVDSSLLWAAVPFEVFEVDSVIIKETVREIEAKLCHNGGVHRYEHDTYYGGGEWLLLSCWLGWYYAETGDMAKAKDQLMWVKKNTADDGEMPEQVSYHVNDESYIQQWIDRWGQSAKPLLWSHAMYIVLADKLKRTV